MPLKKNQGYEKWREKENKLVSGYATVLEAQFAYQCYVSGNTNKDKMAAKCGGRLAGVPAGGDRQTEFAQL